jgi:hypothetical protein
MAANSPISRHLPPPGALLGLALASTEFLFHAPPIIAQHPNFSVKSRELDRSSIPQVRAILLEQIETISHYSVGTPHQPTTEQKIERMGRIQHLVSEYRKQLNIGTAPTFEELSRARAMIAAPINTIYYSQGIPSSVYRPFLQECVFDLYSDLVPHFQCLQRESNVDNIQVASELQSIMQDTVWTARHNDR